MKRKIAMGMTLLIAASVLTACGGSDAANTTADGKIKIRFATWDNAEDLDKQQALVDAFNASHDDIEVTLEGYGSDYDTKISAGMGSGDTPDVMYMWNYPAYYEGLEPLDSYIEGEGSEYKADFYESLWSYNQMEDNIYGIPVGFTTHALYYNKDLFAQAGIEEPDNDWTWEDLKAAAALINEKTGVSGFTFQMKPDPYDFEMYLWSNGTAYCDENGNMEGYLNSDASIETFTLFQQMEKDGYATATEKGGTDEFMGGKSAMFIYGAWAVSTFKEENVNFGIVSIPSFEGAGDSVSILSSSGVAISKDSKNKEAAWEFVKYWTGEECEKARIGYELPSLKSVVESEGIMQDTYNAAFYHMLEQSNGYTTASFIIDGWSEVSETLSLSFERIFNPSVLEDPKTVLDEAVNQ